MGAVQHKFRKIKRHLFCEHRVAFSHSIVKEVYTSTGGLCFYCQKQLGPCENRLHRWEIDHLDPWAKGGSNDIGNLVPACFDCNKHKSDKNVKVFLKERNLRPLCRHVNTIQSLNESHHRKRKNIFKSYCTNLSINTSNSYCQKHSKIIDCC